MECVLKIIAFGALVSTHVCTNVSLGSVTNICSEQSTRCWLLAYSWSGADWIRVKNTAETSACSQTKLDKASPIKPLSIFTSVWCWCQPHRDNLNTQQTEYINSTRACANKIQLLQSGDVDHEWLPYIPNMSKVKLDSINKLLNSIKCKKHHLKCFVGVKWKLDLEHPVYALTL